MFSRQTQPCFDRSESSGPDSHYQYSSRMVLGFQLWRLRNFLKWRLNENPKIQKRWNRKMILLISTVFHQFGIRNSSIYNCAWTKTREIKKQSNVRIRFVKLKFIPSILNIQFFNIQLCLNGVFVQALNTMYCHNHISLWPSALRKPLCNHFRHVSIN